MRSFYHEDSKIRSKQIDNYGNIYYNKYKVGSRENILFFMFFSSL